MTFRHGKSTAVLVGAYDLSAYFNDASTSSTVETSETTTFGVSGGSKTYVVGLNDSTASASGLFDGDAGAVDAALGAAIGNDTEVIVTVAHDGGMIVGRRCFTGTTFNTKYDVTAPVADVVSVSADFQSSAESYTSLSYNSLLSYVPIFRPSSPKKV